MLEHMAIETLERLSCLARYTPAIINRRVSLREPFLMRFMQSALLFFSLY